MCFLADVTDARLVVNARAVARGNRDAVLAVARDADQGGIMIHNHPSGTLEPSHADLDVAARVWEQGLGTAITDNGASELYVVVEPPEPRRIEPLRADELESLLAPGGPLASLHDGFEDRPGQREMVRRVAERFNRGGVSVIEAGTGTGKSLAYLLPAALWARRNGGRTVVSTNTINLQEQLVGKDLPLVERILGHDVDWALVKGRGNYVSLRRARLAAEGAPQLFDQEGVDEIQDLFRWSLRTEDGSLADLPFSPTEEAWDEVRSDPDICLRARCPHFSECFYQRARREAATARILVVNHHMLFSDLAVRRVTDNWKQAAVLPPYEHVILDEAHNVEDAATGHLGAEVTRSGLYRLLSRLDRNGKGVLAMVLDVVPDEDADEIRARVDTRVRPALEAARGHVGDLIDLLEARVPAEDRDGIRLSDVGPIGEPADDPLIAEALTRAVVSFGTLEREVSELRRRMLSGEEDSAVEGRALDLQSVERRLAAAQYALRVVLDPDERGGAFVRWLAVRGRGKRRNLAMAAAPIELGDVLREALFTRAGSVVLTSATLTTRRDFSFLRRRLGLDPEHVAQLEHPLEVEEYIALSPFDFESQCVLVVPTDQPDASGSGSRELDRATARLVVSLAEVTGGGVFVLFTSHRALRAVAEELHGEARWPLFVQGSGTRARLLAGFAESGRGILLGTSSFWEGVDVPGRPLRGLVIQKLPFRVPTDPVTAARLEAVEQGGGNAFWEFLLPLAALRLKQGFGRLIRSRDDRGAVVVVDDRLVRKRYGRYLRDSLPPARFVKGPWPDLSLALRRFYEDA